MTYFMKEYFNSFDDIQFFRTFSLVTRDIYSTMYIDPLSEGLVTPPLGVEKLSP